jgi:hypothetical protein
VDIEVTANRGMERHHMTGDPPPHPAECFDEVFDAYFVEIRRYAAKRLGPDAAADIAAQTFPGGVPAASQEELTKPSGEYAEMKPGFIINYETVRSAAWTDTKPGKPSAELPFRQYHDPLR